MTVGWGDSHSSNGYIDRSKRTSEMEILGRRGMGCSEVSTWGVSPRQEEQGRAPGGNDR